MNKIVVPVDFSDTSKNAARYAVKMAKDIADCEIVLYNVYDTIAAGSDGTPLFNDEESRQTIALAALGNLKSDIEEMDSLPITCMAESGTLVERLEHLVKHKQIDMVVMGINGATRLEQILIGSSTLGVINRNFCPVVIVPPDAKYQKIRRVVFLSDFRNVAETTPIAALKKVLNFFRPQLYVVYAESNPNVEPTEEYKWEKSKLEEMLNGYNPEFALVPFHDFAESINQFATDSGADLVITVPHKHTFLNNLFKSTHTRKLAYHTHLPILALHE
jgi:nucleotide-binding universal stress UspA family protein